MGAFRPELRPTRVDAADVPELHAFLTACDLTVAGLAEPSVRLWVVRDAAGSVVASTGYETGSDGRHVLLRSVAVGPALRGSGTGTALAGFAPADREELVTVLAGTTQVELFRASGQLGREVAWSRPLGR